MVRGGTRATRERRVGRASDGTRCLTYALVTARGLNSVHRESEIIVLVLVLLNLRTVESPDPAIPKRETSREGRERCERDNRLFDCSIVRL